MQSKVSKGNLGMTAKILLAAATLLIASGLNLGATSVALARTYTFDMNSDTGTVQASTATTATNAETSPNSDGYIRPNISEAGIAEVDGVTFPLPDGYTEMEIEGNTYFLCTDTNLVFTCLLATGEYTEDDIEPLLNANSSLITRNYIIDTAPVAPVDGHQVYLTAYEPIDDPGVAEILIACLTPNRNIFIVSASADNAEASDQFLNTVLAGLHVSDSAAQKTTENTGNENVDERPLTYFSVDRLLCLWGDEKVAALKALSSISSATLPDNWSFTPANAQFSENVTFTHDVSVSVHLSGSLGATGQYHPDMATAIPVAGYDYIQADSSVAVTPGLDQRVALDEIVAAAGLTDKFTETIAAPIFGDGQRLTYYGKCDLLGIEGVWSLSIYPSYDFDTKQTIPDCYSVVAVASTLPARNGTPATYEELQALLDDPANQGVLGINRD